MTNETDISALHDAIVADIRAAFPALQLVEFYREDREKLTPDQLPACLLELTEAEADPDEDPGTGQLAMHGMFEARLVLPFRTTKAKLAIRLQAAAFAAHLRRRSRWPGGIFQPGAIEVVGAFRDDFQPALDQYEVWRIDWRQLMHIGASVWDEAAVPGIAGVWLGLAPEIGAAHQDKYEQVHP